jgi:hypothetical protein
MLGRRSEAEKILFDLQHQPKGGYISPYMVATICAGLGKTDAAFQLFGQALQERNMDLAWLLLADPRMDALHSDPRFQVLLRQVGFPQWGRGRMGGLIDDKFPIAGPNRRGRFGKAGSSLLSDREVGLEVKHRGYLIEIF